MSIMDKVKQKMDKDLEDHKIDKIARLIRDKNTCLLKIEKIEGRIEEVKKMTKFSFDEEEY